MRTRVKICGVTRPQDALTAARAGADAIGFVLYPGARRTIDTDKAREILSVLPPFVTPVGIFADEQPQSILDAAAQLNLRHVQLNGDETPDDLAELSGLRVIKAIRVDRASFTETLSRWRNATASWNLTNLTGIVLEPANTGTPGGSGIANDWDFIRAQRDSGAFDGLPPLIAAGGLTPESVGDVVRMVQPWAVDVSSGVEESVGVKSPEKIVSFIRAVRSCSPDD